MQHIYLETKVTEDSIHVEGDLPSLNTWMKLPRCEKGDLPRRAGLYALWDGDELKYIGESEDLQSRITGHNSKQWTKISYLPIDGFERVIWEKVLLSIFFPPLNKEYTRHDYRMHLKQEILKKELKESQEV